MILALFAVCPVLSLFAVVLVLLTLPFACARLEAPIAHEPPSDWAALEAELAEAGLMVEVDEEWCTMALMAEVDASWVAAPTRKRVAVRTKRPRARRMGKVQRTMPTYGEPCPETQRTPYQPDWMPNAA